MCSAHILGDNYLTYNEALVTVNLQKLSLRREQLCLKFARKAENNSKHKEWFKPTRQSNTRQNRNRYCATVARTGRLLRSPIPYLTGLLNAKNKWIILYIPGLLWHWMETVPVSACFSTLWCFYLMLHITWKINLLSLLLLLYAWKKKERKYLVR